MRIYRSNRPGLSGGGKEYPPANPETAKRYVNESHEWMDVNILHGRYPDLYGFLILMEHSIPAEEIWDQLKLWSEQYIEFGENRTRICHRIIDRIIEYQLETDKQDGYPPPYCHRGCSNCCYQAVACTDEEAELIYNYCIENRIYIDFAKLERQQKHMEFDSNGNWQWARRFGGSPKNIEQNGLATDTAGNIIVIGQAWGYADMNGDADVLDGRGSVLRWLLREVHGVAFGDCHRQHLGGHCGGLLLAGRRLLLPACGQGHVLRRSQ